MPYFNYNGGYYDYDDKKFNSTGFLGASKNYQRVCNYCHYAGKYRSVAAKQIPVVFWNG